MDCINAIFNYCDTLSYPDKVQSSICVSVLESSGEKIVIPFPPYHLRDKTVNYRFNKIEQWGNLLRAPSMMSIKCAESLIDQKQSRLKIAAIISALIISLIITGPLLALGEVLHAYGSRSNINSDKMRCAKQNLDKLRFVVRVFNKYLEKYKRESLEGCIMLFPPVSKALEYYLREVFPDGGNQKDQWLVKFKEKWNSLVIALEKGTTENFSGFDADFGSTETEEMLKGVLKENLEVVRKLYAIEERHIKAYEENMNSMVLPEESQATI